MFPCDAQFAPPAPVLAIEVFLPAAPERREQLFAKLDTGADFSGIPSRVISQWGMEPASEIIIQGYDDVPAPLSTYRLGIELPMARIRPAEVIAIPGDIALLGRDILNNLYVRLNGPELTFDVRTTPGT